MDNTVTEIRWHARGGQGAVTAAKTLAEMSLAKNMYFQAFPEYGPERMGAPIQCFNRLSTEKISTYCGITEPGIVVVVDPSLLDVVDITAGLKEDGVIIVNTPANPDALRENLSSGERQIYTVDATRISLETLGRFMPNIPMLGALLKLTGILSKEEGAAYLEESFGKKFSPKVTGSNVRALISGFEEVRKG